MSSAILVLFAVIVVSAAAALLKTRGKPAEKPVKAMMFVAYFWLSAFIQLTLLALAYFIWQRFINHS